MDTRRNRLRTWLLAGALAAGAAVGAASISAAATSSSGSGSTGTTTQAPPAPPAGGAVDPAKMSHGPGETLLTGDTAAKVKAAALAAVPGATVIRVETDSAGSPYEAHLTKSDGTTVTVKVDKNFKVTATESGFGGGPGGAPGGQMPPQAPTTTQ
jgi:hypothetical protein